MGLCRWPASLTVEGHTSDRPSEQGARRRVQGCAGNTTEPTLAGVECSGLVTKYSVSRQGNGTWPRGTELLMAAFPKIEEYINFSNYKMCNHYRKFLNHREEQKSITTQRQSVLKFSFISFSFFTYFNLHKAFCFAFMKLWSYCWHNLVSCFPHLIL
jgi:hypothetical protein